MTVLPRSGSTSGGRRRVSGGARRRQQNFGLVTVNHAKFKFSEQLFRIEFNERTVLIITF
jgi:hypothetical protein